MAQLTPSTQAAARPFSPTQGPRTAESASALPTQTFTGQLDQALAEAAGSQQAAAPAFAGSVQTVPDPAGFAPPEKPTAPPRSLPLPAPAPDAATAIPQSAFPPGPPGKGAATRATSAAQPETGNGEAVPGSSLTAASQPVPPVNPAPPQPATLLDATAPAADGSAASPAGASLTPGTTQPRSPRDAVGKQPRPATLTQTSAEAPEVADPAATPTQAQNAQAQSPAAPALAGAVANLSTAQASPASASRNPQAAAAAPGETVAEPRGGRSSALGQSRMSDDPPPASKLMAASPASSDGTPPPSGPSAAGAAPALTGHPTSMPMLSAVPPGVAAQAPANSPSPSPASQVAEAVMAPVQVTLANPPQGTGGSTGGAQILTIHLKPDELGRVEIRIERPADGPARIELAVERPETLLRLVHDQAQLQQALDQAGISPTGRTIQFNLAPDTSSGTGFGASASGANASGDGASGGNGQRFQQGYTGHASRTPDELDLPITATAWARTGLDITA